MPGPSGPRDRFPAIADIRFECAAVHFWALSQRPLHLFDRFYDKGHVVKRLARDCVGHRTSIPRIGSEDNDPSVVVLHWQPTIVLRLLHHALVLAMTKPARSNIARSRNRAG